MSGEIARRQPTTEVVTGEVELAIRHTDLGRRILAMDPQAVLAELRGGPSRPAAPEDQPDLTGKRSANP